MYRVKLSVLGVVLALMIGLLVGNATVAQATPASKCGSQHANVSTFLLTVPVGALAKDTVRVKFCSYEGGGHVYLGAIKLNGPKADIRKAQVNVTVQNAVNGDSSHSLTVPNGSWKKVRTRLGGCVTVCTLAINGVVAVNRWFDHSFSTVGLVR